MDPHSRHAQYNQRPPRTGPQLHHLRQMELKTTAVFDQFRKSTSTPSFSTSSPASSSSPLKESAAMSTRPIATNSRVRRDEKYRRDMYLAFIDNALTQKARGANQHYDDLVSQFNPKALPSDSPQPVSQLRSYLTALSHVVSKLDRSHIALVDAIVGMPWTTMDLWFVKSYISFIGMLVSARPEYLTLVLEKTAQGLTYHSAGKALDSGFAESSTSPITRRIVYDRVHSLLEQLIGLIPTLTSTLFPLLAHNFPHKRLSQAEHVTYIRNLLRLSDYCPELWDRILGLIIDRTIQIDVEIQVELEDLDAEGLCDAGEVFHLDVFDTVIGQEGEDPESDEDDDGGLSDLSSDAGSVDSDLKPTIEEQTDVKHVQDMVSKLDSILEVIFKHLDRLHTNLEENSERQSSPSLLPSSSPPNSSHPKPSALPTQTLSQRRALADARFHALLSIFERIILRTFKSRYTQFLVFWYSSLDTHFRDHFLGTVVSKALLEPDQPVVTRAAAASYVASYVSRAAFVDRGETRNVVRVLCAFLETHLDVFDAHAAQPLSGGAMQQSAEQHAVFYASAQAVFLIFCFRWRDLLEFDGEGEGEEHSATVLDGGSSHRTWLPQLIVMQRVVNSALNPLKVCSSNVVQQFARVAQRVGFVYCFSILEANKRSEYTPQTGDKSKVTAQHSLYSAAMSQSFDADLTTFFPFDPFKLPRSSYFIDGIYRDWTSVAIEDSEDEDDEEDEEDEGLVSGGGDEDEDEGYGFGREASARHGHGEDLHMHGPSSFVDDAGCLGESFGGMSISPIRTRQLVAVE